MGWVQAVLGVVGAVLAVVAAVVATGASAGAAGVLIGVAVVGSIMAVQDIIAMSIKQDGYKVTNSSGDEKVLDISIAGLVDMAYNDLEATGVIVVERTDDYGNYYDRKGNPISKPASGSNTLWRMTEKEFEKAKSDVSIGITVSIALAMLIVGVGAGMVASKALKSAADAAAKGIEGTKAVTRGSAATERWATGVGAVVDVAQGSAGIYGGTISLDVAEVQRDSEKARAEKKKLEVLIKDISQRMGLSEEFVYKLVTALNEFYGQLSEGIKEGGRVREATARNCA